MFNAALGIVPYNCKAACALDHAVHLYLLLTVAVLQATPAGDCRDCRGVPRTRAFFAFIGCSYAMQSAAP
jgi:hypothetical protein